MARIPDEEIERIKRGCDLVALVRGSAVALHRSSANWLGLCPWHEDGSPRWGSPPKRGCGTASGAVRPGVLSCPWASARWAGWSAPLPKRGPYLARSADSGTLFLNRNRRPLRPNRLSERLHRYFAAAELGKSRSCHVWRHTAATLMHESGADIRGIQEMLGHAQLSTTQVYTRVSIRRLKEVHTSTHPARLLRDASSAQGGEGVD